MNVAIALIVSKMFFAGARLAMRTLRNQTLGTDYWLAIPYLFCCLVSVLWKLCVGVSYSIVIKYPLTPDQLLVLLGIHIKACGIESPAKIEAWLLTMADFCSYGHC